MTVSNTQVRASYTGDGSSTHFTIPFPFYLSTDITVMLGNAVQASGYTITGGQDANGDPQTGTVIFSSAPASTVAVQFILKVPLTQLVSLVDGTAFPSDTLNQVNDRAIQAALRLNDILGRTITAPDGDVSPNLTLPVAATRANTYPVFDSSGNLSVAQAVPSGSLSQATIGAFLYPRSNAETSAGVTPANYSYPPGHILRYGTNTVPGTTDLSTALANALISNSQIYLPGSLGPYAFSQSALFSLTSGQTVYGDGPSTVLKFSFNSGNNLQMNNVVGAVVRDLAIQVTGTGANSYIGAVAIIGGSSYCKVERVAISGVSGCGVYISGSTRNLVRNCSFTSFTTGNQDQADIYIGQLSGATGSAYNVIDGNECFGGGWHGVIMQSQNGGTGPNLCNVVTNNRISNHLCYGIANYSGAATIDNFNQIIGNYIENIQGTALSGQSGAGIYSVSAGGNVIANNTVTNCCAQSTTFSGSTAGISVAGVGVGLTPVVVQGNVVTNMTKFEGIMVTNCQAGVGVTGNTVLMPASNSTGSGILVTGASNATVTGNTVNQLSAQAAINLIATLNVFNLVVNDNIITHLAGGGIIFSFTSSFTLSQVVVNGNQISTTAAANNILAQNFVGGSIGDNVCTSASVALQVNGCQQTRIANNSLVTTGSATFNSTGACGGSYYDKSNYSNTSLVNAATGLICEQLASAIPVTGFNSAVGDRIEQSVPVVGNPKGWRCTVAGNPGTWVSEGNL